MRHFIIFGFARKKNKFFFLSRKLFSNSERSAELREAIGASLRT